MRVMGAPLPKGCSLHFKALTGVKSPDAIYWLITNTGDEAESGKLLLEGVFLKKSDEGFNVKSESTAYTGSHSCITMLEIKRGACVAKSKTMV